MDDVVGSCLNVVGEKGGAQMQSTVKLLVGIGAVSAAMLAGGTASAAPDLSGIAYSTCTYPQVIAALNAQSPDAAQKLAANPVATSWLQQLIASPPEKRQQMIAGVQNLPALQQYTGLISQVANTCNNY
jgi:hemophore-related protein